MPALGDWCREGDGVLKTLPAWLFFWWRLRMQQKTIAAMIRAAPMSDPITMPAMAPPEIPEPESRPPDPAPAVELGDPDEVLEGNTGGIETVVGRSTPTQRDSTFALTQQESVELTVLEPQKRHNPWRLPWYPHSSGSFLVASMQLLLSELAGLEQRAKSERISGTALLPGVPHRSGLDTITCSLIAKSACVCQPYNTV